MADEFNINSNDEQTLDISSPEVIVFDLEEASIEEFTIDGALMGPVGADGLSAYDVWLLDGNSGTEADFLLSIKGEKGDTGSAGSVGAAGAAGPKGDKGDTGDAGATGPAGSNGSNGSAGATGATGAAGAAATISVGSVTTVDPGDPATVTNVGTSSAAIFDFEIPQGDDGADGAGTGDMTAAVYDPTNKAADAFSQDNMVDGTTNKNYTATEKTKLGAISGTNTGDETTATIKTKLSITTLSGSNTGDQTTVTGNAGTATALATSRNIDGQAFNGTADITVIAPGTFAATSKATPVDADTMPITDSAASNVLKKLTWANLKATAKTYFDTLYQPVDTDLTTIAGLTATTNNFLVSVSSAWASRTPAQVKTTLSLDNVDNTSNATERAAARTLTNARVTPRVNSITSSGTPTTNTDNYDVVDITALAAAITSMTTNLSGTPTVGQKLLFQIKDNGTARAITWGASFTAKGVALPTTTVISKLLTVGFIYNGSNWGCVASAQEA